MGTTFTLKLPLTMAIIDGFLVAIGGVRFILPLFAVEECIKLAREEVEKITIEASSTFVVRSCRIFA